MPTTLTRWVLPGEPGTSCHQAVAVLKAAEESLLYAYIVLSLLTGVRTEEARDLRWDHVPESALDEGRAVPVS